MHCAYRCEASGGDRGGLPCFLVLRGAVELGVRRISLVGPWRLEQRQT